MGDFYIQKRVVLKCNEDDVQFPIEVLNQWDITHLEIIGGNFTYFPKDIAVLKNLRKLSLISTKIENLPVEVFELEHLKYLSLKNNRLSNLPDLKKETKIEELILGRNYLNEQALEHFFKYTPHLYYLDLGHNLLRALPESLVELQELRRLVLDNNKLNDFPEILTELRKLIHLSLEGNSFSHETKQKIESVFRCSL